MPTHRIASGHTCRRDTFCLLTFFNCWPWWSRHGRSQQRPRHLHNMSARVFQYGATICRPFTGSINAGADSSRGRAQRYQY